jgi:hypothetical protein
MSEKIALATFLAKRMDVDACQKEIRTKEQNENIVAQNSALLFDCSITSTSKFGNCVGIGYLVKANRSDKQFWIWGAGRPMNKAEIEADFNRQLAGHLFAGSCWVGADSESDRTKLTPRIGRC